MDSQKDKSRLTMSDSGLGSLGSESDISPSQAGNVSQSNSAVPLDNTDNDKRHTEKESTIIELPRKKSVSNESGKPHKKFIVTYFGHVELDKRYTQPQFWKVILQWVVAEIKRFSVKKVICLEVETGLLNGVSCEKDSVLFQHDLHHLSKFSRTHQDTRCFAYLTKNSDTSFDCHLFQASEDSTVLNIFHAIRDATKAGTKENVPLVQKQSAENQATDSFGATSLFEVLYIGKIIVSSKKAPPTFIDDAVSKFKEYEDSKLNSAEEDRHRHSSGTSVQSLPNSLEKFVAVKENELCNQASTSDNSHSNESNVSSESGSDTFSSSVSIDSAQLAGNNSPQQIFAQPDNSNLEDAAECDLNKANTKMKSDSIQRTAIVNQFQSKKNRTMLLQIAKNDVCLISPDRKRNILRTNFKDISFCSQGINHPEYFGFISRDVNASSFYCYVFRCVTEIMVEEVMQTLKVAFNAAFQQSAKTHMCELCPMHQLHKLAEEIDKRSTEETIDIIKKRIDQLTEDDQAEILDLFCKESAEAIQEQSEVYMIILRHMCEDRQKDHVHISDPNKSVTAYEFTLTESAKARHSKFDDLRNRAKKSLSESFETIKERVRHKSGEAIREIFRERSDSGSFIKSQEGGCEGGYLSPISSPTLTPRDPIFSFNSPSPIDEEKLSPSARTSQLREMHDLHSKKQPAADSCSTESALVQKDSPLRAMFLKAGSKEEVLTPAPQSVYQTPSSVPPSMRQLHRTGSWRKSIFERVVTPAKVPRTRSYSMIDHHFSSLEDDSGSAVELNEIEQSLDRKINSQRLRRLWKKAILETLLIIRMKRNIKSLQTRPDDEPLKLVKLDYEEITPCLKEVTKVWEQMLSTPSRKTVCFEKARIANAVKDGVPRSKRGCIWQLLVEQHKVHNPGLQKDVNEVYLPYEDLLKQLTTHQHAILIDLGRTFPSHPYFSTQLGAGQLSLFNILKAYSLLDKEVGYCQGLSFVAGVLLMHMEEKEAFDALRYMMFILGFRKQYRPDMKALQLQMYQLSRMLHDYHRDLYEHLDKHEIAPTLYAAPWFLTMFASQFPLGFVARVFDLIFLQGMEVVLRVALVVLGNHKELIKQCDSFESIVDFLKTTLPEMGIIQMERVFNQVYSMDCSKQLNAYEVEYHVLQEEMVSTPQRGEHNHVDKLEAANHNLKRQNLDLLEQLQTAHNINHSLDIQIHNLQANQSKLNSHIRTLELERGALLNTMAKIKKVVTEEQLIEAGIEIPSITTVPNSSASVSRLGKSSDLDREVAALMTEMTRSSGDCKGSPSKGHYPPVKSLFVPGRRPRRPSSSEK